MKKITFTLMLVLALAGCSKEPPTQVEEEKNTLEGTVWKLLDPVEDVYLYFNKGKTITRVDTFIPNKEIVGTYSIADNTVIFSDLYYTFSYSSPHSGLYEVLSFIHTYIDATVEENFLRVNMHSTPNESTAAWFAEHKPTEKTGGDYTDTYQRL